MPILGDIARFASFFGSPRNQLRFARFAHGELTGVRNPERSSQIVDDFRVAVRNARHGFSITAFMVLYEFHDLALVAHLLRETDTFVDVGANAGIYTVTASGAAGARSIAFEPGRSALGLLRTTVQHNRLEHLVDIREVALGEACRKANLTSELDVQNHVVSEPRPGSVPVDMETMDHALTGVSPTMLKIDVEGYEGQVLRAGRSTLLGPGLQAVITENRSDAVVDILERSGFRECRYDPVERRISRTKPHNRVNGLFVRDLDFIQERVSSASTFALFGTRI
jgi:FkbM family methyltransferase